MAFNRSFDLKKISMIKDTKLWKECLLPDILNGAVFPAIRDKELHFYCSGGRIFSFSGNGLKFNRQYLKPEYRSKIVGKEWEIFNIPEELIKKSDGKSIDGNPVSLESITSKIKGFDFCEQYQNIKLVVAEKFKGSPNAKNIDLERKYLERLYPATFGNENSDVIVFDIEVRANYETALEKAKYAKCDLMLFNIKTLELQLVEAKLCNDPRVKSQGSAPEVIEQVRKYNSWLLDNKDIENFVENYKNYTQIINQLFDKKYKVPKLIKESAKLAIFEVDGTFKNNHLSKLTDAIGAENIVVFDKTENKKDISAKRIWNEHC